MKRCLLLDYVYSVTNTYLGHEDYDTFIFSEYQVYYITLLQYAIVSYYCYLCPPEKGDQIAGFLFEPIQGEAGVLFSNRSLIIFFT